MKNNNTNHEKSCCLRIGTILLKDWDPIGIKDIPEAQDEYEAYIVEIYQLLVSGKPEKEIFNYLWWIETKYMGLPGNMQHTKIIAKKLRSLF